MAMHCEPCLGANHRGCRILLPLAWEDDIGRCICQCAGQRSVKAVAQIGKPVLPPGKRGPRPDAAPRPTKWNDDRLRQLVQLKAQGLTSRQIGAEVGAHMDIVRTYLGVAKRKGIT